jgi:hypothetical protein
MFHLKTQSKTILQALAAMLLFATMAAPQITGLCNTGQTSKTISGCTGVLVTPNPTGGGPNRDGNWQLAYPYPSILSDTHGPCDLKGFVKAWVDTPDIAWLPNSVSSASEWITPYDGAGPDNAAGWYVYRTAFHVPSLLPGGIVPTGLTINGQLASDNATYAIYLENPADSGSCSLVSGLPVPINPAGSTFSDFDQWWPFSFTNSVAIIPGTNAYLYVVVLNLYDEQTGGPSNTGLRVEFFASSAFN